MRKKLSNLSENKRYTFKGTFVRLGTKPSFNSPYPDTTVLLKDIRLFKNDQKLTDHLWFNYTRGFQNLGHLNEGDVIKFDGRVSGYLKDDLLGEDEFDLKISFPTKLEVIEKHNKSEEPKNEK